MGPATLRGISDILDRRHIRHLRCRSLRTLAALADRDPVIASAFSAGAPRL